MKSVVTRRVTNDAQPGAVMVELAVAFPALFLVLFFGALEFSKLLESYEMVSVVVRESANSAFRECAFDIPLNPSCLDTVRDQYVDFMNETLPESRLILTMYIYDTDTGVINRFAQTLTSPIDPLYPMNNISQLPDDLAVISIPLSDFQDDYFTSIGPENPTIVVGEMYHEYTPRVSRFFKYILPFKIYDVSVF